MGRAEETFVKVEEVQKIMGIGKSKAYHLIRQCNDELAEKGFLIIRGKCPRKYFEQKIYGLSEMYDPEEHLERIRTAQT